MYRYYIFNFWIDYSIVNVFYIIFWYISERHIALDYLFFIFRHHVPVTFYLLFHLNNLFLVVNSSINFIIYYFVGLEFKKQTIKLSKEIKEKLLSSFVWTKNFVTRSADRPWVIDLCLFSYQKKIRNQIKDLINFCELYRSIYLLFELIYYSWSQSRWYQI